MRLVVDDGCHRNLVTWLIDEVLSADDFWPTPRLPTNSKQAPKGRMRIPIGRRQRHITPFVDLKSARGQTLPQGICPFFFYSRN